MSVVSSFTSRMSVRWLAFGTSLVLLALAGGSHFLRADEDPPYDPPPYAADDYEMTDRNQWVEIHVLYNDSPYTGYAEPSSVTIGQEPAHGDAIIDPYSGSIIYFPDNNYTGSDSFTYAYQDGSGQWSNTATVYLGITLNNTAPEITQFEWEHSESNVFRIYGTVSDNESMYGQTVVFGGVLAGKSTTVDEYEKFELYVALDPEQFGEATAMAIDGYQFESDVETLFIYP